MRIGYLGLGGSKHGVRRYAAMLSAEARSRAGVEVVDVSLELTGRWRIDREGIVDAASRLGGADVVHLQHTGKIWGGTIRQARAVRLFTSRCASPIVGTLHDVTAGDSGHWGGAGLRAAVGQLAWNYRVGRHRAKAFRILDNRCERLLVCSEHEAAHLEDRGIGAEVIPHYVPDRTEIGDREASRSAIGLADRVVVVLLGFIYRRKGHDVLVEALPHLPERVVAVFAGQTTSGAESYLRAVLERARWLGVGDRVRVTGDLTDEEMLQYLAAADVAVCPFRRFSASGTIADWISVGRRVLSSRQPQISEFERIAPGVIETFDPYSGEALAAGILQMAEDSSTGRDPRVERLARQWRMSAIWDRHFDMYQSVAGDRPRSMRRGILELS